jgi:hypothetical protein
VKETLPPIADLFPQLIVKRRAIGNTQAASQPAVPEKLDQSLQLQAARTSFPLIRLRPLPTAGP